MPLLPSQQERLFVALARGPIEMDRFDLLDSGLGARVVLRGSDYNFEVANAISDAGGSYFLVNYLPGQEAPMDSASGGWEAVEAAAQRWVTNAARELAASDPWAELAARRALLSVTVEPGYDNSTFTPSELDAIRRGLDELRALVAARVALDAARAERLDQDIAYLKDAAARTGRTDYRGIFQNVMWTLVAEAIVPLDVVRQGIVIALHGVAHLFGISVPDAIGP
jgi:hypothetical protein